MVAIICLYEVVQNAYPEPSEQAVANQPYMSVWRSAGGNQTCIHFKGVHLLLGLHICQLNQNRLHTWHPCITQNPGLLLTVMPTQHTALVLLEHSASLHMLL